MFVPDVYRQRAVMLSGAPVLQAGQDYEGLSVW
jgi:hypothetical protein